MIKNLLNLLRRFFLCSDYPIFEKMKSSNNIDHSLFESIFEHATMGIVITNEKGEIVLANGFAESDFGYQKEELVGRTIEDLIPQRFHKVHQKERHNYYHQAETRAMGAGRDLFAERKDGSEFPVEVSLSPFHTDDGTFVIAFIIDITIRKEKEKAEMQYQEKLDQVLRSLTKEKELNDLKSRFVSMASHEFRTPLSTILSSASLINKYVQKEDQEKRQKHTDRIVSSVKTLTNILDEFLSIGKMEDGKIEVRKSKFDLKLVIESVMNEMTDVKKQGQQIQLQFEGKEIVCLDKELLKSIVINLLSNAIKFSEQDAKIFIQCEVVEDEMVLRIEDNGLGIPLDDQKHLFERFFRGTNVLNIQGTGLGLNIVARYVELMGGTISFQSTLGKGTRFKLRFTV